MVTLAEASAEFWRVYPKPSLGKRLLQSDLHISDEIWTRSAIVTNDKTLIYLQYRHLRLPLMYYQR